MVDGVVKGTVPGNMNRCLREYQREGIEFLASAYYRGQGAILADEVLTLPGDAAFHPPLLI